MEAEGLLKLLSQKGLSLAVAESLTGGLLADAIVSVPGASRVFAGGAVCYQTPTKSAISSATPRDTTVFCSIVRGFTPKTADLVGVW